MSKASRRPPPNRKPAAPPGIDQRECAERLGLTTRQIKNLADEGMPRVSKGGRVWYLWPEANHWYLEKKIGAATAKASDAKGEVWKRKAELDIRLAELEVAKAQGQVISIDYAAGQWEQTLFLLRARAVAIPTRYQDDFVLIPDAKAARKKLDELIAELLTALSDAGDDASYDDVEDADDILDSSEEQSA